MQIDFLIFGSSQPDNRRPARAAGLARIIPSVPGDGEKGGCRYFEKEVLLSQI